MRHPGLAFAILLVALSAGGCRQKIDSSAYGETLDLKVTPATVESGTAASIVAEVKQAMMPKAGVKVSFSASGNCGTLSAPSATTQTGHAVGLAGDGQAIVDFKGNSPFATCSAMITATAEGASTAQNTQTTMVTVLPKGFTRSAPDSSVAAGETAPTVTVTPDVTMPVTNGFTAQYSVTVTNGTIDSIQIQSGQICTVKTSNQAVPPNGGSDSSKDLKLVEPVNPVGYNSDVLDLTSESLKLGRLIMTVNLKTSAGAPVAIRFTDAAGVGTLPGPG